jgi:predicted kinase
MLILMCGLPGAGKSWLAHELVKVIDADILDRDVIRDRIFPQALLDYSAAQNELASRVSYQVAEYILARHPDRVILLDGRPFSKRKQIEVVKKLAERLGQTLKVIYCWAPDEVVLQRLAEDFAATHNVAAGRNKTKYERIKREFEPLTIDHLDVDTSQPLPTIIDRVLDYLNR